jgi:hypothetical protein
MRSEDITPAKFKCGLGQCTSIHKTEDGVVIIGDYRSRGELISLEILPVDKHLRDGESAVFLSDAFLDAFVREYVAKRWLKHDTCDCGCCATKNLESVNLQPLPLATGAQLS